MFLRNRCLLNKWVIKISAVMHEKMKTNIPLISILFENTFKKYKQYILFYNKIKYIVCKIFTKIFVIFVNKDCSYS